MADTSKLSQSNKILFKWTIGYFFCLWLIFKYLFDFDMFSRVCWVKFFTETLHGFLGLVFVVTVYGAILIYIATIMIIYRKNKPIVEITVPEKVKNISSNISKIFSNSKSSETNETQTDSNTKTSDDEYPSGLPPELYIPYMRAKQHKNTATNGTVSDFNKTTDQEKTDVTPQPQNEVETESFPIPSDFDISDELPDTSFQTNDSIPTFKDLDFDIPITSDTPAKEDNTKNTVIKYCEQNGIEYEILDDFVMMKKYLIYDHNDEGFWVMDDDNWFASGKQMKSPIEKLIELADQNSVAPVMYFESTNVLDIEHIISKLESRGVRAIMNLSQLP